jgi:hypothetical protein
MGKCANGLNLAKRELEKVKGVRIDAVEKNYGQCANGLRA